MGGRVVDGTGLENRHGGNVIVGSNPTPSASLLLFMPISTNSKTGYILVIIMLEY